MNRKSGLSIVYIVIVLLFLYLPMACVVVYSFNISKSSAVWSGFTLDWYAEMIKDRSLREALGVSLRVALLTSVVSAVLGTSGAVAMNKLTGRLANTLRGFVYIPLVVPEITLGVATMVFFSFLRVPRGVVALMLAHSTFCIPYVFILVHIRLKMIDPKVMEAARDLGATRISAFFTVTLPLILPAIGTSALLAFAMSLDDVIISSFVSGTTNPLQPQIHSMLKVSMTPKINALCTLILVVTFLVAGLTQAVVLGKTQEEKKEKKSEKKGLISES